MKKNLYLLIALSTFSLSQADTLHVGLTHTYKTPNDAAKIAKDGDLVLIDSGTYQDQACNWNQNNITIRGTKKYARLIAPAVIPNGKAIWVTRGTNITLENIEFTKAIVPDKNGAGIRAEGLNLTIKNCYFHNNQEGILGGRGTVKIENTIFENNGHGDGYSHNVYIGHCDTLIFRFNYSHHAKVGHNLKTRAKVNIISYNRIMDEKNGTSSFCIDIPNGGLSIIKGNLLQQGKTATNFILLALATEGVKHPGHTYIVNNTIVNERARGIFIKNFGQQQTTLINNLFIGDGITLMGKSTGQSNIEGINSDIVDMANFNYKLSQKSRAINAGTDLLQVNYEGQKISLAPTYEYVHPASSRKRAINENTDAGAYEYTIDLVKKNFKRSVKQHYGKLNSLEIYNIKGVLVSQSPLTDHNLPTGIYLHKTYEKNGNAYIHSFSKLFKQPREN